jgi:uncharacterized protein with NRDE domain
MCLIGLAHHVSPRFPLVIAANRDEEYVRPTHDAHHWNDAPDVVGGKDALYGGTWLAVRRGGRFAAVTNLRGAVRRTRSRGALVRDFVTGDATASDYARSIAVDAQEYAGFHLLAGEVEGEAMYISPEFQEPLLPGIHAFSNAPAGELWPKVEIATDHLRNALAMTDPEALIDDLLQFLGTARGAASYEGEVFIAGDRYGTRSSTVIVATRTEILFAEQTYAAGGVRRGEKRLFCLAR